MSYHTLKYGARFLKGTHGFWFTLGAVGIGFLVGKKVNPKNKKIKMLPILGAKTRKYYKDFRQGWYGIVDEARGNLGKSEPKKAGNEVKVNRQEVSGYQTETISRV